MRNFDNWNRYLDNNGKVLHGCIEVMVKDGNTPADIYDRDGTALANPQLTDNFGRSDQQIFINADVVAYFYKYIGNGTLVEEQELGIDTSDQTKWNLQYTIENIFGMSFNLTSIAPMNVPNMAALRALNPNDVPEVGGKKVITLLGYNTLGDKEPINYVWNPNSYANDNGGNVIQANSALTGRWIMVKPTEHVDSKHFGVFPQMSGTNYDYQTLKINNLFDYCNAEGLRPFFNGTDSAKYFAYTNLSAILKEPIDVSYGTTFVDDGTNALSIPSFNGDPIFKNHNTQLFTRTIKTKWNPKANSQYDEVIIDNNPGDMRAWTNKMVVIDEFHTGLSFNNCDMVVNDKISGSVTIENMELKQEWFTTTYDWTDLTSINNRINLDNFDDPNVYITLKNKQHEADYGDLNEQTISNVTLLGGAIAENGYFNNVTLSGNTELHNISGNVVISGSPANLNFIDTWLTIANTANVVISDFSLRRGNITMNTAYYIQIISNLYLDNVDVNAIFYTPGINPVYINSTINVEQRNLRYAEYTSCIFNTSINLYPGEDTVTYMGNQFTGYWHGGIYSKNVFRNGSYINLSPFSAGTDYSEDLVGVDLKALANVSDHNFIVDTLWQNRATGSHSTVMMEYEGNSGGCPLKSKKVQYRRFDSSFIYKPLRPEDRNSYLTLPEGYATSGITFVCDWRSGGEHEVATSVYWIISLANLSINVQDLFTLPNLGNNNISVEDALAQGFVRTEGRGLYTNTFHLSAPLINAVRSGNNVILSTVTPIRSEWVGDRYYGNDDIDEHRSSLFYVWYDYKDDPTRWVADLDLTLTSAMFANRANY